MCKNPEVTGQFLSYPLFSAVENELFGLKANFSFKNFSEKYVESPIYKKTKLSPEKMYEIFKARIEIFYYEFCFYHLLLYFIAFLYAMNVFMLEFLTLNQHKNFRSNYDVLGNKSICNFPIYNLSYQPSVELSRSKKKVKIQNIEAFKIKAPPISKYRKFTLNGLFFQYLNSKSIESLLSVNSFSSSFFSTARKETNSFELEWLEFLDSQQQQENESLSKSKESQTFLTDAYKSLKKFSCRSGEKAFDYSFFSDLLFGGETSATFHSPNYNISDLAKNLESLFYGFETLYSHLTTKMKLLCELENDSNLSLTFPYFKGSINLETFLFSYLFPPNCVPSFEEVCLLVSVYDFGGSTESELLSKELIEVVVLEGYSCPNNLPQIPHGFNSIIDYYGCSRKSNPNLFDDKTGELFLFRKKLGLLSNVSTSWAYKDPFCSGKVPKLSFFSLDSFVRSLPCIQSLPLDVINQHNLHPNTKNDFPVGINTFSFFNIYYLNFSVYLWFIFSSFSFYDSNTSSVKNGIISTLKSSEDFPYNLNAYGTYSTINNFSERLSLLRKKKQESQKKQLTQKSRLITKFKNHLRGLLKLALKSKLKLKLKKREPAAISFFNSHAKKKGHLWKTKQFVCFVGYAEKHQIHLISKKKNHLKILLKLALKSKLKLKLKKREPAAISFFNGYVTKKGHPSKQVVFSLGYVDKQQIHKLKSQIDKWVKKFNPLQFYKKTQLVPRKQSIQFSLLNSSKVKKSQFISSPPFAVKKKIVQYQDVLFESWRMQAKVLLANKPNIRDQNPLRRYVFRWSESPSCFEFNNVERIKTLLKVIGVREYVFQLEKNPITGIRHYQGYFRFDQKHSQRPNQILSNLSGSSLGIEGIPFSFYEIEVFPFPRLVSLESVRNYCSKKETRADGPFIYPEDLISFIP